MAKHFCGGELAETAFFKELQSCCDGMEFPTPCCELEHLIVKHDDNTQITFQSIDPPGLILLYTIRYPSVVRKTTQATFVDNSYSLLSLAVPDKLAELQTFLI